MQHNNYTSSVSVVTSGVGIVTSGLSAGITGLMNLAAQGCADSAAHGVFSVTFNQDFSSIGVGTKHGYKLFSLNTVDKIEQICDNVNEDTCVVERLFSSSLVAVVSLLSPRKLKVCHFKKNSEICNYSYPNTILAVKLNRARLVVCLEESLYIHNIRDMKVLHTIRDTPPNPMGLCALSISNENCYLAYPGSNIIGQVQIFDSHNLLAKAMIPAHDSPLAAMAFNASGTKIATASEKGTVIRVFNVSDGSRLHELRRGMKRCATIFSLSFSPDSLFLLASSNTVTVHVFKLEEVKDTQRVVPEDAAGIMGWMSKAVSASASYLPSPVTDMLSQGRAFATVTLPFQGVRNVCAIATIQKQPRVVVASTDGYLYIYNLNTLEGGDCTLLKQHKLDCTSETGVASSAGIETGTANKSDSDDFDCLCYYARQEVVKYSDVAVHDRTPIVLSVHHLLYKLYGYSQSKLVSSMLTMTGSSYAGVLRGRMAGMMSAESEKITEMMGACEPPYLDTLKLDDDTEFPPV